jgi:hypothetical protein
MSKNWRIDRRTFLRGVAGALLPLPFLNLMEGKALSTFSAVGNAATDKTLAPPLRFLTLFKPNGVHPPSWSINGGREHDFRLSPLMESFARHKDDLLILDNLGDIGFSTHANSTRRFLSGHHENINSPSIDQIIADNIRGDAPHRSLELTTEGLYTAQFGCSYISYDQQGDPISRESDPQLMFDRLFRSPMSDPNQRKEMSSLLDAVKDDANDLKRKAGYEDRQMLDQYLTVVRETERRIESLDKSGGGKKIDFTTLQRPEMGANLDEQVNAMMDIVALALWTDSTRCISYMLGNSNSRMVFDFLGISKQHHFLSHFFRNPGPENLKMLMKITVWHMQKFDQLLTKLKSYKDHNGTLLDHSIVLFGSGMGHSDNHTVQRLPIILAGGKGILKTGRYLRYSENQEFSRLHLSLLNLFGIPSDTYAAAGSPLPGLDGGYFKEYQERPFDSYFRRNDGSMTVQGRLRMSDNIDETNVFYIDVDKQPSVRLQPEFKDFHEYNLAYHVGTPVRLTGTGSYVANQAVITKITDLVSVFGKSHPVTNSGF